ncbi:MAG: uroporphyrinogen-III synthase [Candidatus Dormibacteria bacterium]
MSGPLLGRRVMVTRAAPQSEALSELLVAAGAVPVPVPVMRVQQLLEDRGLDGLRARIAAGGFDDLVLTSANAVELLLSPGSLPQAALRVYAIGPGTAAAVRQFGWSVEPLPAAFIAESLASQISERAVSGRRVLLPRARGARDVLPRQLRAQGAEVEVVELYQMVPDQASRTPLRALLRAGAVECATFTSGSSVRCFVELAGALRPASSCAIACIGPITAAELRRQGMHPQVVARTHTMEGLVSALGSWFGGLPENGERT